MDNPFCKASFKALYSTCVVTPPAGLWCVAAASKAVQTQHVSSAPWSVSATVLDVSIILQRVIQVLLRRGGKPTWGSYFAFSSFTISSTAKQHSAHAVTQYAKELVNYLRLSLSLICSQYRVTTSHLNTHKHTIVSCCCRSHALIWPHTQVGH